MRVIENPGRSVEVETGARNRLVAERASPFAVSVGVARGRDQRVHGIELDHQEGLAFLHGLAALYDCEVVQH